MIDDMSQPETKKEKTIKHGMIVFVSLAVTILLIAVGIYIYG